MLIRENEGSKKRVRKVVQDFVHQQYDTRNDVCVLVLAVGRGYHFQSCPM